VSGGRRFSSLNPTQSGDTQEEDPMLSKRLYVVLLGAIALAVTALPAHAQGTFPALGDDTTSSMGSFKIFISPNFVNLFYNPNAPSNTWCTGFDPKSQILTSPTLLDGQTVIGRSNPIFDASNDDMNGTPVGTAGTIVSENMLIPPPGFPCGGLKGCGSGAGNREVHTEIRSLKMTLGGGPPMVRAGIWYDSSAQKNLQPSKISPGEVESQFGPSVAPFNNDFKASSFFDVFVQVDIPACGTFQNSFPSGTLYNLMPLVVKNNMLTSFPPNVVYLHDSSSIVPILFLYDNPGFWHKDDILGYFVLVGHGIGFGAGDTDNFNGIMGSQTMATCPIPPPSPSPSSTPVTSPSPQPSPSPSPSPQTSPAPQPTPTATPGASRSGAAAKTVSGGGKR
jgi:hypothetical protein